MTKETVVKKLESEWEIDVTSGIQINISLKNITNLDRPKQLHLFITSKESWFGLITESWPYFKPNKATFNFNDSIDIRHWFDMYVSKVTYKEGLKNIKDCFTNLLSNYNCTIICKPFFFSFLHMKPTCESLDDTKCMYYKWFNSGKAYFNYKKCLKPETTTLYDAKPTEIPEDIQKLNAIRLLFTFSSDEVVFKDETLMIGFSSFIGSIGGSLGLFLGFSCFTSITFIIDKLFLLCKKTPNHS